MTQTSTAAPVFNLDTLQADPRIRAANEDKFRSDKHIDVCYLCGRGITAQTLRVGWSVRVENGSAVTNDTPETVSQGTYPVGSECAKKIPAQFRTKGALAWTLS